MKGLVSTMTNVKYLFVMVWKLWPKVKYSWQTDEWVLMFPCIHESRLPKNCNVKNMVLKTPEMCISFALSFWHDNSKSNATKILETQIASFVGKKWWPHSEECMCRLRNIAMLDYQESVTTGQTDGWTDRCAAMLRRRHKKGTLLVDWLS